MTSPNTVSLSSEHDHRLLGRAGRTGPIAVLRPFDAEVRHLALDDAGIGAKSPWPERLEEDLGSGLAVRLFKRLRGKNPGGTPLTGAPPGGFG